MSFTLSALKPRKQRLLYVLALLCAWPIFLVGQGVGAWQHQTWSTAEGLPQASVHALAQTPDGFLWAATEDGLARFDGLQFKVYTHEELGRTTSDDLCCLVVDARGVLWIGSSDGLAALKNSRVVPLPDRAPFAHSTVRELSLQNGQAVAVTDAGAFSLRADGRADAMAAHVPSTPLALQDRDGSLWAGSADGLKVLSAGQHSAVEVPSLAHQAVLSLIQDTEGDVWAGTETTGLHRLRRSVFRALDGSRGTSAAAVAWSSDGVLLGTREGDLRIFSPSGGEHVLAHLEGGITALSAAGGDVWAATTNGLYRIDRRAHLTRYTSADGLPDDYIRSLAVSGLEVWAGTAHGLAHISGNTIETLTHQNGLGGDLIGSLLPAPARSGHPEGVWVATEEGLSLVEGTKVVEFHQLHGAVVAGMSYDANGEVWLATQDGWLWRHRPGSLVKILRLSNVSARHAIQSLFVDQHDTLWIVLRDGLLSASLRQLQNCWPESCGSLTSLVAHWGVADGMPSAESLPGGLGPPAADAGGNIVFATRAGIAVADSASVARVLPVSATVENLALEDQPLSPEQSKSIPYGRNRIAFEYAGLSLGEPARVRYRVRLRGFDPGWVETGVRRTVTYTALAPGNYTFAVQATLEGQPWPETLATVDFRIAPPFYRRWWFLTLACIFVAAVLFAIYHLRLAAERRRFALVMAERNRLAREMHDTLAQDLVSTGIQLDVVMYGLGRQPQESTLNLLRTLRRRVAQALAEARESIGELRDPNVRLDLPSRLRRMAERRSTQRTPVTLDVVGITPKLKPGMEIELLRIGSEAVENALRHSRATAVKVRFESRADSVILTVVDDGLGFLPAEAEAMSGHDGLKGMQERAEALGATLAIDTAPGQGTTVRVSLGYSR